MCKKGFTLIELLVVIAIQEGWALSNHLWGAARTEQSLHGRPAGTGADLISGMAHVRKSK